MANYPLKSSDVNDERRTKPSLFVNPPEVSAPIDAKVAHMSNRVLKQLKMEKRMIDDKWIDYTS